MYFRRLLAIATLLLLGGILAACGSEDTEAEPTATIGPSTRITSDQSGEIPPTPTETSESTAVAATPAPDASPVAETSATPTTAFQPQIQPPHVASPVAEDIGLTGITGTLTLEGREQQDYTVSPEGCVGLGEWRQLQAGTQVIVRDASGTVVDIATLEPADAAEGCVWAFSLEVPSADFFSISIPMVTEVWFEQNDSAVQAGEIELTVP